VAISLGVYGLPCSSHQVIASTNSADTRSGTNVSEKVWTGRWEGLGPCGSCPRSLTRPASAARIFHPNQGLPFRPSSARRCRCDQRGCSDADNQLSCTHRSRSGNICRRAPRAGEHPGSFDWRHRDIAGEHVAECLQAAGADAVRLA
jgi:hypothetical protein